MSITKLKKEIKALKIINNDSDSRIDYLNNKIIALRESIKELDRENCALTSKVNYYEDRLQPELNEAELSQLDNVVSFKAYKMSKAA